MLTLGVLTLIGLGIMIFAAYMALVTRAAPETTQGGHVLLYVGYGTLVSGVCFVIFLLGSFIYRIMT